MQPVKAKRMERSVDGNALALALLGLGYGDGEDAIVQIRDDTLLVDWSREAESARELADGALRNPELFRGLLLLRLLVGSGDLRALLLGFFGLLVGDGGLVAVVIVLTVAIGDGATGCEAFNEAGGRSARGVVSLSATRDDDRLGLGELDVDVVFLDAGELTVELVAGIRLLHVEAWRKGGQVAATVSLVAALGRDLATVVIEVVEETEERRERGLRTKVGSREQRHLGCGGGNWSN